MALNSHYNKGVGCLGYIHTVHLIFKVALFQMLFVIIIYYYCKHKHSSLQIFTYGG